VRRGRAARLLRRRSCSQRHVGGHATPAGRLRRLRTFRPACHRQSAWHPACRQRDANYPATWCCACSARIRLVERAGGGLRRLTGGRQLQRFDRWRGEDGRWGPRR
jgi:hypothetical protein